ncbi:MAG: hypothetical protein HDT42_03535 [Ruminococcaceae bacterium]|nr:hypothetical protein [Oscillospiraceae bacterium]
MEGYIFFAEQADILSCDCSTIEKAYVKDGNLHLKTDSFLYGDKNPYKCDCLLILEHFSLIDEQANADIIPRERWKECEEIAANRNLHLYLTFDEFLESTCVEVQGFDFEWEKQYLTITGYDGNEDKALWCSLKFYFQNITAYWNEEKPLFEV